MLLPSSINGLWHDLQLTLHGSLRALDFSRES